MNNYIFFVEGKKTEYLFLKKLFPYKNIVIDTSNGYKIEIGQNNNDKSSLIVIKWIVNGDVVKFIDNYKLDPYNEGLSLSNYYMPNDYEIEFSNEFLIIDLDSTDLLSSTSKVEFLKESYKIISKLDNTHMLISSPMFEAFYDVDSKFVKSTELKQYKNKIGASFNHGQNNISLSKFDLLLKKNIEKFDNHNYDKQRILCLKNFTEQKILVLSLVHHILFEYYLVYDYESLVINLNKERIKIVDVMYISDYLIDVTYNTGEKFRINIESKLAIKYYAPLKNKSLLAKLKSMDNSIVWELEGGEIKISLDDMMKLQK